MALPPEIVTKIPAAILDLQKNEGCKQTVLSLYEKTKTWNAWQVYEEYCHNELSVSEEISIPTGN